MFLMSVGVNPLGLSCVHLVKIGLVLKLTSKGFGLHTADESMFSFDEECHNIHSEHVWGTAFLYCPLAVCTWYSFDRLEVMLRVFTSVF